MKTYNIADILLVDAIDKNIKRYGIEGTEDKIKKIVCSAEFEKIKKYVVK